WVLAMQSGNGGWAAFDKDNTSRLPALLPFCDFGEVIDPPSADVTAHVVEMLGEFAVGRNPPAIARGLRYLYRGPAQGGSCAGRADTQAAHRGARFLLERQRADGAWDEESFTGCGFPGYGVGEERGARVREGRELCAGFMIRYHLYRNCFPLLALGRYRAALA